MRGFPLNSLTLTLSQREREYFSSPRCLSASVVQFVLLVYSALPLVNFHT